MNTLPTNGLPITGLGEAPPTQPSKEARVTQLGESLLRSSTDDSGTDEDVDLAAPMLTEDAFRDELTRRMHTSQNWAATVAMQAKMEMEAASIQRREDQHPHNQKPLDSYLSPEQVEQRRAWATVWAWDNQWEGGSENA